MFQLHVQDSVNLCRIQHLHADTASGLKDLTSESGFGFRIQDLVLSAVIQLQHQDSTSGFGFSF